MLQERAHRTWAEMLEDKGEERGIRKGRLEILEEQLETKFGPLQDSVRARLQEADSEDLLRWSTRLLSADDLREVFC